MIKSLLDILEDEQEAIKQLNFADSELKSTNFWETDEINRLGDQIIKSREKLYEVHHELRDYLKYLLEEYYNS